MKGGGGAALMAEQSKGPQLTSHCLSPMPGFESRAGHVRKFPVVSSTSYNLPVTIQQKNGRKSDDNL